jgi:ParB-like chromosome segregation protein Spo0J
MEPQRLTAEACDGDATPPTGEHDPAPAGVETPHPPVGDTRDDDAAHRVGEPDPAPTDAEPPRPPVGDTRDGDAARPTGGPDPAPADAEPSPGHSAAVEPPRQEIPVDKIFVVGTRRALVEEKVPDFVKSIKRSDLLQPIIVRIQEDLPHPETAEVLPSAYVLVAGLHRLEAHRRLGRTNIPAIVLKCSPLEAELRELEENLIRAELTADQKAEQTLRMAAVIKEMEESLKDSDFLKPGPPARGRGHKGTIQKVAERSGVNQGTVRHRTKHAEATIGEPVDLHGDSSAELRRKADKLTARAVDSKTKRKAARSTHREKTQAAKPAHKDRDKAKATKLPQQPDLVAAIRDLNVNWRREALEAATAGLTDSQKADLRQHLPDLISKLQWLADSIGPRSAIAAAHEISCANRPGLLGSG